MDHGNGTYSLEFKNSPYVDPNATMAEKGRLTVWLEYTCDVGKIMRPFKDSWATNGATLTKWTAEGVPRPPIIAFVPPNADKAIDLGQFVKVLGAGDSVMQHFFTPWFYSVFWDNLAFTKNLADTLLRKVSTITSLRLIAGIGFAPTIAQDTASLLSSVSPLGSCRSPLGTIGFMPDQPYTDHDLFPNHIEAAYSEYQ
jgi:hypothetical protein